MGRFVLGTYNCFYRIGENGFKNFKEQKLTKLISNIVIERKTSIFENKISIKRKDEYSIKPEWGFSFFEDFKPKIPDNQNSELNSKMVLHITEVRQSQNSAIVFVLRQKYDQHTAKDIRTFKFNNIKLIIKKNEAYLIYPNGMGRLYRNE